jgi:hypothetical protein
MPKRTPDEIRASIEANRQELGESLEKLRDEVTELTDWRSQLRRNRDQLAVAALATGFVLGGGIGGTFSLVFGHRRRKRARRAKRQTKQLGKVQAQTA